MSNAHSNETLFQRQLAAVDGFMWQQGLNKERRRRILRRMRFTWEQQKSLNESQILDVLPVKIRYIRCTNIQYFNKVSRIRVAMWAFS